MLASNSTYTVYGMLVIRTTNTIYIHVATDTHATTVIAKILKARAHQY